MNAPDLFSQIKTVQALEAMPPQLLKIMFDYLFAIGTTDDELRRHYAAHVLAANDGDLVDTAKSLGLEQGILLELFTDSASYDIAVVGSPPSENDIPPLPRSTDEIEQSTSVVLDPVPTLAAMPVLGAKLKKLDALIEDAYTRGIGVTAMLQLPGFEGVKKQAISNRVTELKLPHRFPEAAQKIKEAAKALHRARVQKTPIVDNEVAMPQADTVGGQPEIQPEVPPVSLEAAIAQDAKASSASAEPLPQTEFQSETPKQLWTPELIELLREKYPSLGPKGLQALPEFANCDVKSIQNKAFRLKIKMDAHGEQARSMELRPASNEVDLISATSLAAKVEEAVVLQPKDVAAVPASASNEVETTLPRLTIQTGMAVETAKVEKPITAVRKPAPQTKFGSEYYASKFQSERKGIMSDVDIEAAKVQIAERKKTLLEMALATLPECVTQQLTIQATANMVAKDSPKAAFERQLKAQGFIAVDTNNETQGPGKQSYLSDYYWHKAGVLASISSGAKLDPTLHLHAQLISPAGTQPLIKPISPMPSGGRYTATCSALNGERKVACVSYQAYKVVDGLEAINSLLGMEVLLLSKFAVPPRADDHGFVTFRGSIARHKRLSLAVTQEPLRSCCFPDTKAVFTSHL